MSENDTKDKELLLDFLYHVHQQVNEYAKGMLAYYTIIIGGSIVAIISFLSQYTPRNNGNIPDAITSTLYGLIGSLAIALALILLSWLFAFLQMYYRAWSESLDIRLSKDSNANRRVAKFLSGLATILENFALITVIASLTILLFSVTVTYNEIKPFYKINIQKSESTKNTKSN